MKVRLAAGACLAVVVGIVIGGALEPNKVKTVTVNKPVTSQSCLEALDSADAMITILSNGIEALIASNVAALERLSRQIDQRGPQYQEKRDECRAGASEWGG